MSKATGIYFDGQSTRGHPVTFEFVETGVLRLAGDNIARETPLTDVRASERLADIPRFLYLPNDGLIETADNDVVDAALAQRRQARGSRIIHALESQQRIAAVACVIIVLAIAALGYYGPPTLARLVANRVPADVDQHLGAAALTAIRPYFSPSTLSAAEQRRVSVQLARLRVQGAPGRVRLEFRKMNGGLPNAFALPGNVIIVTDELVRLPATDDEIAAVLAHELGHLEKRHGVQSLLRQSFALLIVAAITGDLSAMTSFAGTIPLTILTAGYSRDLEREADRYALELLRTRNIPPRAFATVLAKLDAAFAALKRNSTYVSTHPATEERVALFGGLSEKDRSATLAESALDRAEDAVRRKDHTEALTHLERAVTLAPTARTYTSMAQSHFAQGNHALANSTLLKALELDPEWAEAHVLRTEVLTIGLNSYAEAIVAGKRALELAPENATVAANLGFAKAKQGNREEAAADLERAIAWDPTNYRGWAYRGHLRSDRDVQGATADYDRAIELQPDNEWLHHSRGMLRNRQRDFKRALQDFAAVRDPSRWTGDLFFERGLAQQGSGKHELAIADYTKALEKTLTTPLKIRTRMSRASAYGASGSYRSAIADYTAIIKDDPKFMSAYAGRAFARHRAGEFAPALEDIEQAIAIRGEDVVLLRERGNLHWDLEDHQAALRDYDRAIELRPDPALYRARGLVHFGLGDWTRAEADLTSLITTEKTRGTGIEYTECFLLLARRRAETDDQRAAFAASVAKWPRSWVTSIAGYLLGNVSETQLLAETALGNTPPPDKRRCEAYFYIGQTHLIAGDRTAAREFFEKCVETKATTYFEYKLAKAELTRLRAAE